MKLIRLLGQWRPASRSSQPKSNVTRRRLFRPTVEFLEGRSLPSTAPVPIDPGFEKPALGAGVFQYDQPGSPWTFTASAGLSGNGSAFTGSNPGAPQGSQVAFLQGAGSVSQNVNFPAGVYAISFVAAQRASSQASAQTFQVLVDGIAVGTFNNLASTSYTPLTTSNFTVTAGSHLLTFQGTDLQGGDNTVLIDQVSISVSDFQTPALGNGAFQYNLAGGSWTYSGSSGLAGNGSGFTTSNPGAPLGNQVAFIQSMGSISQSIVFAPGTYQMSFSAAQRGTYQASTQTFQVLVDGTVVGTFNTLTGASYTTLTTSSFTVTAGSHTVVFQGTNLNGGDNTVLIDQLAINPLPTSLTDSGFETPALANGTYAFSPGGSPWTFQSAGVAANGSAFTINNPGAPQGNQVAFIHVGGSISQSVLFPLGTFQITFSAAQRGSSQDGNEALNITVDNNRLYPGPQPAGTSFQTYTTPSFTVTPGRHLIVFTGSPEGSDSTLLLDQITIVPVATGPNDAGFETPQVGSGSFQYNPAGSPWLFNGYAGLAGNGSGFTIANASAPQGNQAAFLQQTGSISQTVTFPIATNGFSNDDPNPLTMPYDISFSAAQRGNYQANSQTFEVLFDGNVIGTFNNLGGTSYSTLTTFPFLATGDSHTITFQGTDLNGGDNTVLLDQVAINPLPLGPGDPQFLLPSVGQFSYQADPAGSPWTFSGSAGLTGTISAFTMGNDYALTANGAAQVAYLQARGSVSQSITFPAGTSTISFVASQRANVQASLQTFQVLIDGNVVGTFNNVPATKSVNGLVAYLPQSTPSFTVTAGSHLLTFQGTDIFGGDNTIFLNDIVVNPIVVGPNDPGFETPTVGYGTSVTDPTGAPWAYSGSAGVSANNSPITSGNPLAPAGSQVAFLQGSGSISQNLSLPFGTYQISFSAAQRGNVSGNAETFEVLVDGNVVGSFNVLANISYTPLTTSLFTIGSGSHTITFQGTDLNAGNYTVLLDQVALNPVAPLDGSFEVPLQLAQKNGYTYNPTGSAWLFGGSAGMATNGSAFTSSNPLAPDGYQVAFLQGQGSISQSFSTLPAGTYDVTFDAAQRATSQASFQTFNVLLDGRLIGTFVNARSTSYTPLTTSSFTVGAGLHTLLFQATDLNGGDNTVLLDQIAINNMG